MSEGKEFEKYLEDFKKEHLEKGWHVIEDSKFRLDLGKKLSDGTYPQIWIDKEKKQRDFIFDANYTVKLVNEIRD